MSIDEAVEQHRKAAEHFEYAAKHHTEAGNHYCAGRHEAGCAGSVSRPRPLSPCKQSRGPGGETARAALRAEVTRTTRL